MAETRNFYQPVRVTGTLTVTGASTLTGAVTTAGTLTASGGSVRQVQTLAAGSQTMTTAMANRVVIATEAGVQTFTLPTAASLAGSAYTFVCGNAGGEILVTPNAADQISSKGLVDHSTSVKPTAGTGIKNTAATNVLGDHITLVSDGVLTWHEVAGAGIWASQ